MRDQEDDEILEESPCKRWSKRCEKVKQRDVPGIDAAYLAMDNETGNEVVWNEVLFSERKNFREQEEKIRAVFDNLVRLEHPNLVKFHKYWIDTTSDKPRIVFITEYMSSGSMSRFLQRARSSGSLLNIKAWKSWTRQILTALSYLHSCDPPIVHANLTCNSVFIQQNGLVKIGCVAPKTIHHHVKTFRENIKNVHYLAPEYDHQTEPTIQADIYSFGVCALEMATTGALQSGCFNGASTSTAGTTAPTSFSAISSITSSTSLPPPALVEKERYAAENGIATASSMTSASSSSTLPSMIINGPTVPQAGVGCSHVVTQEMVHKALNSLDQPEQKHFIERCLELDPARRANVTELLDLLGPPEPEPDPDDTLAQQDTQHPVVLDFGSSCREPPRSFFDQAEPTAHQQAADTYPVGISALEMATTGALQSGCLNGVASTSTAGTAIAPPSAISSVTSSASLSLPTSAEKERCAAGGGLENGTTANASSITSTSSSSTLPPVLSNGPTAALPAGVGSGIEQQQQHIGVGEPLLLPLAQHRETRQVMQLHAELLEPDADVLGTKLRLQLQLDDLMNRQLTTTLRDGDTGDSLAAELVQNGFVSEANSQKVCELLTSVIGARTVHPQQQQQQQHPSGRRGSSSSATAAVAAVANEQQQPAAVLATEKAN